jgi:hypothetical protein
LISNQNIKTHKTCSAENRKIRKIFFTNPEEQFSQLKNEEKISKEFYLNEVKEFESKTGEQ